MRTTTLALLTLMSSTLIGCGYLDTDLALDEEEWEESMSGSGEGSIGGGSHFGVGGGGSYARGGSAHGASAAGTPRVAGHGSVSVIELEESHVVGRRTKENVRISTPEATLEPSGPVDWVGYYQEVSMERQNTLLAAWVEAQLTESASQ